MELAFRLAVDKPVRRLALVLALALAAPGLVLATPALLLAAGV